MVWKNQDTLLSVVVVFGVSKRYIKELMESYLLFLDTLAVNPKKPHIKIDNTFNKNFSIMEEELKSKLIKILSKKK